MSIFGLVTIASLIVYLGVGFYSAKGMKTIDDFYVMGRNAPSFLITGTLIATNISSVAFVGYVGASYTRGSLPYIFMYGATVAAGLFLALHMGRYIWRMKLFTVPDFFTTRYADNEVVKAFSTAIVLSSMLIYNIAVCQGINVVLADTFGFSTMTAQLVILGVVTVFTMAGGMKGVVITDTIMFCIFFFAALLVAPYLLRALGGWPQGITAAVAKVPQAMAWNGTFTPFAGFWFCVEVSAASVILILTSPQLLSRVFIARSEKVFARAMIMQALLLPIFNFMLLFVFSCLGAVKQDIAPTSAFTYVAMNLAPPIVGSIALAGITAAALSSASSLIQQAAAALSRDVYERYINKTATEKQKLFFSRLAVLVIAVVTFIGGVIPQITTTGLTYGFLFATAGWSGWFPALLFGVYWKKANTRAAAWSMALGFIFSMIFVFTRTFQILPAWIPPNIVGLVTSTAVYLFVTLSTPASPEEIAVYENMRKPVLD